MSRPVKPFTEFYNTEKKTPFGKLVSAGYESISKLR